MFAVHLVISRYFVITVQFFLEFKCLVLVFEVKEGLVSLTDQRSPFNASAQRPFPPRKLSPILILKTSGFNPLEKKCVAI